MPNAAILGHLGLFIRPQFLSAVCCRQIRSEMAAAPRVSAMVRPYGQAGVVLDHESRRTGVVSISASTAALVEDKLRAIQSELDQHFQLRSLGWQDLRFYIYEPGDFFAAHRDADADTLAPDWVKKRRISVSILLNDAQSGRDAEPYSGGALVFHGHRRDGGNWFSIPLQGEAGMFVAFRADWMHEVQPVTSGRRYSIVTWLF